MIKSKQIIALMLLLLLTLSFSTRVHGNESETKNIILVIGDGMGFPALGLLRHYSHHAPHSIYKHRNGISYIEQFMREGSLSITFTEPSGAPVVDSAAAGSQLATGYHSLSEAIGSDAMGNPRETVLELANRKGKATGLVSDTRLTHATPASFASHMHHRSEENDIAEQMIIGELCPDVMLSGGLRSFLPRSANDPTSPVYNELVNVRAIPVRVKSKRIDDKNLLDYAEKKGNYQLAFSREDLNACHGPKVLGLFDYSGMPDGVEETWQRNNPKRRWPTLDEMTEKALTILDNDPDGFFLMVEAGQIDWAEHSQDAGQLLHEMIRLDRTLEVIKQWARDRDDTVIIITADHDTGGFTMTYTARNLPNKPQKIPGSLFSDHPYQPGNNFGSFEVLDDLYNQKMSFYTLLNKVRRKDSQADKATLLVKLVSNATGVNISLQDALRILRSRENPYYVPDHKFLSEQIVPDAGNKQVFFTNPYNMLSGLIAARTGIDQNISWSTGTHSAAPVPVIIHGPGSVQQQFPNVMHLTDIGKIMKKLVGGNE